MGNALRLTYGHCCNPVASTEPHSSESLGPHGVSPANVGVSALARDLFNFEITSQVPDGLSQHVSSSKRAQLNWYKKLVEAWRNSRPPPRTPEEATRLIVTTLKKHQKAHVEGLLKFYGLPLPQALVEISIGVPSYLPQGAKYEMQTLPVDAKSVSDGDTINVYVKTTDSRESSCVPKEVQRAMAQRSKARSQRNYARADELHSQIVNQGYRVLTVGNDEVLSRKYRIRLRGIDAPESAMPYGKEAKAELLNLVQGRCLRVFVYDEDRYGRSVADVYSNGVFVQEVMLKKGMAWHYTAYDKRPELANWEQAARSKRVGLWASPNPEKPWEWRKNRREGK